MKGDFSRLTFDPAKHYHSVRLQQGRLLLDSDWNEQADIQAHRQELTTADIVGSSGAPGEGGGFQLGVADNGTELTVSKGRIYVQGLLCENEGEAVTSPPDVADLLDRDDGTGTGVALVYLDAWLRDVSSEDDPALRHRELGGVDTSTRAQVAWQVRWQKAIISPDTVGAEMLPSYVAALIRAYEGLGQLSTNGGVFEQVKDSHEYKTLIRLIRRLIAGLDAPVNEPNPAGNEKIFAALDGLLSFVVEEFGLRENDILSVFPAVEELRQQKPDPHKGHSTGITQEIIINARNELTALLDYLNSYDSFRAFLKTHVLEAIGHAIRNRYSEAAHDVTNLNEWKALSTEHGRLAARGSEEQSYPGSENHLYRIEVHSSAGPDTPPQIKWSRDNAMVIRTIEKVFRTETETILKLNSMGPDEFAGFPNAKCWVEIINGADSALQSGELYEADGDRAAATLTIKSPSPIEVSTGMKVRRWDGVPREPAWNYALENEGISVSFEAGSYYAPGDYWLIPARASMMGQAGWIEWPEDENKDPKALPPFGGGHRYCPLGLVFIGTDPNDTDVYGLVRLHDYRPVFPALRDLYRLALEPPTESLSLRGSLTVDRENLNQGDLTPGITFGLKSGELTSGVGISSARSQSSQNPFGLDFYTQGTPRLSITENGDVGIGVPDPQAKLEVRGEGDLLLLRNGIDGTGGYAGLSFRTSTQVEAMKPTASIRAINDGYGASHLAFVTRDIREHGDDFIAVLTERLRIWSGDGEIGIGTGGERPASALHIHAPLPESDYPVNLLTLDVEAFGNTPDNPTAADSYYIKCHNKSINQTHFYVRGNGNVGIRTTNPQSALQVGDFTAICEGSSGQHWSSIGFNLFFDGEWKRVNSEMGGATLLIGHDELEGLEFRMYKWKKDGTKAENFANLGTIESFINSSKVGIGTDKPQAALQVRDLTVISEGSRGNYWSSIGCNLYFDGEWKYVNDQLKGVALQIGDLTTDPGGQEFRFLRMKKGGVSREIASFGTTKSYILMGNVGIGTGDPSEKLVIQNNEETEDSVSLLFRSYRKPQEVGKQSESPVDAIKLTAGWHQTQYPEYGTQCLQVMGTIEKDKWIPIITFRVKNDTGQTGWVGIGAERPSENTVNNLLQVRAAWCDGNNWNNVSSIRYKKDVLTLPIKEALALFANLSPVTFRYKDGDDKLRVGFIAEDVPELVSVGNGNGISEAGILGILTRVVQHQQQEIGKLKAALTS